MLYAGRRKKSVKNLIYFFGLAALCVIFVIVGVRRLTMTSVALEQQTVCGKEEHVHGTECYDEYGILRCEREEHIHGNDCYLILLADNDINVLLVDIDESEDHSLESVVEDTVSKAVNAISSASNTEEADEAEAVSADTGAEEAAADAEADEEAAEEDTGAEVEEEKPPDDDADTETADETEAPEVTDEPEETEAPAETEEETQLVLDKDTISAINEAIASDGETPDLVLNEDANVSETVTVGGAGGSIAADASAASAEATDEPEETEAPEVTDEPEETEAPGMSLTAVGDSETNNAANVFIYLDGSWTCIGAVSYGTTGSFMDRQYTFSTSAVEELLNEIFGEYTTYSYYENFYILYATSLTANYFTAAGNQETVTVGRNDNKRYLKICSSTSVSNPIYFYSVTYNYLDGTTSTIYVPTGTEIALPGDSISWENDSTGTKYSSGTTYTVTGKTSFTETSYSVSYVYLDGTTYTDTVDLNDIIYLRTSAYGWTTDYSDYYDSGEQYEVLASVTFYEAAYTVTYEYLDGTTYTDTVKMNTAATLRTTDYGWTTDGGATIYASEYYPYTVTESVTFSEAAYTVTYYDVYGDLIETVYVPIGELITLRTTDYVWDDESGNTYDGGETYTPTADISFTEHDETLTITYTLNYPSALQAPSTSSSTNTYDGYTADEDIPYIVEAGDGETTYTYTAHQSKTVTTASSSSRVVESIQLLYTHRTFAAYFAGWQVTVNGTTYTIEPGEEIDWDTLSSYASNGTVTFTGLWDYSRQETVNFFVKLDTSASGGSMSDYTEVIYTTYVFNGTNTSYALNDENDANGDNYYTIDSQIRERELGLVDEDDTDPYLYAFPSDEYIFEQLQTMVAAGTTLTVDGITVELEELTTDYYEVRWYLFQYPSTDCWHIDGQLVRKTGDINVYKTFEGSADAVAEAAAQFSITAVSQVDYDTETFTASNAVDVSGSTYHWVIEDATYQEEWVISEKDVDVGDYNRYTTYRVVDSTGNESATGESDSVTVYGMVYQKDIGEDEALNVYFTNIYTASDTIIVRKVDSMTGNLMSGSGFSVYRQGTELVTFDVDTDGTYIENEDNEGAEDTLTLDGGYVTVKVDRDYSLYFNEVLQPTGYEELTESVILGYNSNNNLAVIGGADYATYNGGVLTIYNTPTTADITVTKTWTDDTTPADITLWLMADNRTAAALLPNWTGSSEVTLTASSGVWTYTWDDVPLYADGEALNWSVLETKIGSESISSGSFDSYIVTYTGPTAVTDSSGTHISIGITNDTKSVRLHVTKIDGDTGEYLSGAVFRLRLADDNLEIDSSFDALTLTSGMDGTLTFTDIPYGTYLLTETTAPDGYSLISDAIYVTINTDDTVSVSGSYGSYAYVDSANAYGIIVENYEAVLLPATGGHRTLYSISGAMMMLAALVYITLKKRGWTS